MTEARILEQVIRRVYRRWLARMILRGLGVAGVVAVLSALAGAWIVELARFSDAAIMATRVAATLLVLAAAYWFLARPLARRPSHTQIALYLEEHEPSLRSSVLSAAELYRSGSRPDASPAFVDRVVKEAVEELGRVQYGRRIERAPLAKAGALAAAAFVGAIGVFGGPGSLGRAASALLPWAGSVEPPYGIEVLPRDTVVARGSDLRVEARLLNFDASEVELAVKRESSPEWERAPMAVDEETGRHTAFLLKLGEPVQFFVEAAGVRSQVINVNVADLPYVQDIALEYRFPAYTGLAPQRVEGTGDIAALRGTRVRVEVTPTVPPARGMLVIDARDTVAMEPVGESKLAGELRLEKEGFYRVVFETAIAKRVVGSPDYIIDVLEDQPPGVRMVTPGRDLNVTAVEEVYLEAAAEDDYGVTRLELVYSVNGGEERVVSLYSGAGRREVTGGYTFFLEEWSLKPGDLVSYYARAADGRRGSEATASDIYFLKVRPFERTYRQADQQPGGGGADGAMNTALSERQREIVAATFNLVRDRARYSEDAFRENLATLALAQGKLREEVQTLSRRIESRGIVALDSMFREVAEALEAAIPEMLKAEELLGRREPGEALGPEQRALQQLQRAEAAFREVQVARAQGGGGGGGSMASAEELADLFDLELDKLRNQYERVERGRREAGNAELDAVMEKLRELAQRQQQENERLRAWAERSGTASGDPRAGQRRLAQEAEELARRLERLAREQSRPELEQTARRLREAAEAMRRAAASGGEGLAQGRSALDQLREARRMLERQRNDNLRRNVEEALQRAERLARDQREMEEAVGNLGEPQERSGEAVRRLQERKLAMASELGELEKDIDQLARDLRREQPEAGRKLAEAGGFIRDAKVREKILYSRGVIQSRSGEYARNFEEQIRNDLEQLGELLREARDAVGETREQRLARALEETRDLVRGLESLGERLRLRQQEPSRAQGRQQGAEQQGGESPGARVGGPVDRGPGGYGGWLSPDEVRQFDREFDRQIQDALQLRELLRREGIDVRELDGIIDRLRRLDDPARYSDPRSLAMLEAEVVQGLKEFEYAVRRTLEGNDRQEIFAGGSEEVPAEYRKLVEEYFRVLSEQANRPPR
ncbi:MAG: hypothetical protein KatS3mg081_0576 [Gemmatimonadales bacterium]|nr:MAG: hypothetical protein KatS3mg081_0576 [Gemmatimonadales bacterium]